MTGPTAVGKSALSMILARRLKTEIISADSAQVYRGLDIGTAKPGKIDQAAIKHHLIDIREPDQGFSVAEFQKEAEEVISQLWGKNKLPFIVGGTGLYIQALTDGYSFGQKGSSKALRKALLQEAKEEGGPEKLYERLKKADPRAAAKIHPRDERRLVRALEVYELEGSPISEQEERTLAQEAPFRAIIYILSMERAKLYERINLRVEKMIEEGLISETEALWRAGYGENAPGMQVLGYRQILSFLKGELGQEEAILKIQQQTRNLAKRQLTWFRRMKEVIWLETSGEASDLQKIAESIYHNVKELLPRQANNTD